MNKIIIAAIVIVVVAGAAWFFLMSNSSSQTQTPPPAPSSDANSSTEPSASVPPANPPENQSNASTEKDFTVSGQNFSFSPSTLTVNKGDHVKITFVNSDGNHNLVIDEFNVKTPVIASGASATVEFTADRTGSFQYYCSVGSHRAMGMWGTLTVQ